MADPNVGLVTIERSVDVPLMLKQEKVVEVPQIEIRDILKKVPRVEVQYVEKQVSTVVNKFVEKLVQVPQKIVEECALEVPQIMSVEATRQRIVPEVKYVDKPVPAAQLSRVTEKVIEVPQITLHEEIVEVPQVEVFEVVKQVPRVMVQVVEKRVPRPVVQLKERIVEVPHVTWEERVVEVPEVQVVEVVREVPVAHYVEERVVYKADLQQTDGPLMLDKQVLRCETQVVERRVPRQEVQFRQRVESTAAQRLVEERAVEVPRLQLTEVMKQVPKIDVQYVEKRYTKACMQYAEVIVDVPAVVQHERAVPVVDLPFVIDAELIVTRQILKEVQQKVERKVAKPVVELLEKVVDVPVVVIEERVVEVPQVQIAEVLKQVPKEVTKYTEKRVPKKVLTYSEKIVEVRRVLTQQRAVEASPRPSREVPLILDSDLCPTEELMPNALLVREIAPILDQDLGSTWDAVSVPSQELLPNTSYPCSRWSRDRASAPPVSAPPASTPPFPAFALGSAPWSSMTLSPDEVAQPISFARDGVSPARFPRSSTSLLTQSQSSTQPVASTRFVRSPPSGASQALSSATASPVRDASSLGAVPSSAAYTGLSIPPAFRAHVPPTDAMADEASPKEVPSLSRRRLLDDTEDFQARAPLAGLFSGAVELSLREALGERLVPPGQWEGLLSNCMIKGRQLARRYPSLTQTQRECLVSYSVELEPQSASPYTQCNARLRDRSRGKLREWAAYIFLLVMALRQLPPVLPPGAASMGLRAYKGFRRSVQDLEGDWAEGEVIVFSGFLSVAERLEVIENSVGPAGPRTILQLQLLPGSGRRIDDFSFYEAEEEILLEPGSVFQILSVVDCGGGLSTVECEQLAVGDVIG